jgi:hypothetical protein
VPYLFVVTTVVYAHLSRRMPRRGHELLLLHAVQRGAEWRRGHGAGPAEPAMLRIFYIPTYFAWRGTLLKSIVPGCRYSSKPLSVWQGKEAKPSAPTPHTVPPPNSCNAHAHGADD